MGGNQGSQKKKKKNPRPAGKGKWLKLYDTVELAKRLASRLGPSEVELLQNPLQEALASYIAGELSEPQWTDLDGACELARRIERLRVVKGLATEIKHTHDLLQSLKQQCTASDTWSPPAPTDPVAKDLQFFVKFHVFQLQQLTLNEFRTVFLQTAQTHLPGALDTFYGKAQPNLNGEDLASSQT
jgi:hypothetical protein